MIHAYSQRMMPPYSGVVQIAESDNARAQSFDGTYWEIHFLTGDPQQRVRGYALDRGYFKVGHIQDKELSTYSFPAFLDADHVNQSIHELFNFICDAQVPFAAADVYEFWLLDRVTEDPIALVFSCCDESLIDNYPLSSNWTALPHSKMSIENTDYETQCNEAPVNQRLQNMMARRLGSRPEGGWVKREAGDNDYFPGLLITEHWQTEEEYNLCQRYLERKAPRLLMLHGITTEDRQRMEIAAKQQAFEVEQYYPLYPEINDEKLMSAIRVEARLRRNMPQTTQVKEKKKVTAYTPFSKDMRILE